MSFLSSKEKQNVIKICENRSIKITKIPKLGFFLINKQTLEAWHCLRNYLNPVSHLKGKLYLPIDERSAVPVSPYEVYSKEDLKKITDPDDSAAAALSFTSSQTDTENHRSRYYDYMSIAVMGVVAVFIIFGLLVAAGRVDMSQAFQGWFK